MNKKGFTLVELLGTVLIISIIGVLLTTTVNMSLNSSKKNACKSQESTLIEAAKMYLIDDTAKNKAGEKVYLIGDLKNNGYLPEKIVNPVTNEEYNEKSYVAVVGSGGTSLSYQVEYRGEDEIDCLGETNLIDITDINVPTFSEKDTASGKTVTINYPEECKLDGFTCTYQKDDELEQTVKNEKTTQDVPFTKVGTLIAKVKYKGDEVSSSYTVSFLPLMKSWNSNSTTDFHNSTYKTNITSVEFVDLKTTKLTVPTINNTTSWDVSEKGNGSVIAWVINDPNNSGKYKLYIGGNNRVYANSNSSYLFCNFSSLKSINNLSLLDTSKTINMMNMFANCSSLTTLDLKSFDTSNVINMESMFIGCKKLTSLNLSGFNTSKVTSMSGMFFKCEGLTTLNVSHFNTSNVIDMSAMFEACTGLTSLDVSNFNTAKVTDMRYMFAAQYEFEPMNIQILDLSNFNTSKVTNFSWMFHGCSRLTSLDLSSFNTANANNMDRMFYGCSRLTSLDLNNFNTSKVTSMESMFATCYQLTTIYASNKFNTTAVTSSAKMFESCSKIKGGYGTTYNRSYLDKTYARADTAKISGYFTDLSIQPIMKSWGFGSTTDFHNSTYKENITSVDFVNIKTNPIPSNVNSSVIWDISEKENGAVMAWVVNDPNNSGKYKLYIGGADKVYANGYSAYMFRDFTALKTLNIDLLDTSKVTNMSSMFYGCKGLTSINLNNFNTSKVTNMSSMFMNCSNLKSINISKWNTSNVTNLSTMFDGCYVLTSLNLSNFNTAKVTNMHSMFYACKSLTSLDLHTFKTSNVTNMQSVFEDCEVLVNLSLNGWDTAKVTNMREMFSSCSSLTALNLSYFNTSSLITTEGMFRFCSGLTSINLTNWNTSNVTNMSSMFEGCSKLTSLNVSHFNTSKVTDLSYMFGNCSSLTSLNVNTFNTSNVTNMRGVFYGCSKLTSLNLTKWNTSKVIYMGGGAFGVEYEWYGMFANCSNLTTLDLSSFDTSKVTEMHYMFFRCNKLKTIYVSDKFKTSQITVANNSKKMFESCNSIKGGNGTTYSSSYTDKTYARIDKSGQKGYFTKK